MANQEHLEILKKGVPAWNEWRTRNAGIKPDLSEVDLGERNSAAGISAGRISARRNSTSRTSEGRTSAARTSIGRTSAGRTSQTPLRAKRRLQMLISSA